MRLQKLISINDLYLLMVFALVNIASAIPLPRLKSIIADGIGLAAFHLSQNKRRRCEENLARVFGSRQTPVQMRTTVKESFREYWHDIFSLRLSKGERTALKQVEIRGMAHLTAALNKDCGVILLESSFFGRRNLAKQILRDLGISVHQVHRVQHLGGFQVGAPTVVQQRLVKSSLEKLEKSFVAEIIYLPSSDSLTYAKQLLDVLRKNEVLCVSGDGKRGRKHVPVQFLGRAEHFPTGMMSLGKISGAPLLPIFCIHAMDGATSLIIEPPIEFASSAQRDELLQQALAQYLQLLESFIKSYPGAYRGWHALGQAPMH